jgi:hypothetical protein
LKIFIFLIFIEIF